MISLRYDGEIHISTFSSRMAKTGKNKALSWSEFLPSLLQTTATKETIQEYFKMSKEEQDRIKDVGAYVGGWLKEGRRKTGCVEHRTLLTLDADFAQPDMLDAFDLVYGCLSHPQAHPGEAPPAVRDPPGPACVGGGIRGPGPPGGWGPGH